MAFTKGTVFPFAPSAAGMSGRESTCGVMDFPSKASDAYRPGDIVVLANGITTASTSLANANQTAGTILGIAAPKGLAFQTTDALHNTQTMPASVTFADQLKVYLALPGQLFNGNLCTGAATDYTTNAAADVTAGTSRYDTILGTDAYSLFLHIDQADATTTSGVSVIKFVDTQVDKTTGSPTAFGFGATNIVNPRVYFTFPVTVWTQLA